MDNMDNIENMENVGNNAPRRQNPRRRKRSAMHYIKAYLPIVAIVLLVVLFIVFAVGSVKRANEKREQERQESLAAEASMAQQRMEWEEEALRLIDEAEIYAASCDYEKAIEVLDSFSGNLYEYSNLVTYRERYENGDSKLVLWEETRKIPCLSFGKLIIDPETKFKNSANREEYISTAEFNTILQLLFDNGYMLVDLYDVFTTTTDANGETLIVQNELKLPGGKKPIILVQTQPYGYEHQLVVNSDGSFTTKVTPESGDPYTGSYDFVPLLEDFIRSNPGFSYKGARAVLAVTGFNGYFGYKAEDKAAIQEVVTALKEKGYVVAGNTYANVSYGRVKFDEMQEDAEKWEKEAEAVLGATEVLVYARSSDISDEKTAYTGKKYDELYKTGFRYYFGLCYNSNPWMSITDYTVRIGRIMVTGGNLKNSPALYTELFDPAVVLGTK